LVEIAVIVLALVVTIAVVFTLLQLSMEDNENIKGGELTQYPQIIQKAMASSPALAINGALFVLVTRTSHSLDTPDRIAIMLFKVVMTPNMLLELVPALSIWRLLNSVTIQLSKALYIRLVLRPPKIRPKNRTGKLGTSVEKHDTEEVTQNTRHAVRRPCLSAN
jgi:hypothetical protein